MFTVCISQSRFRFLQASEETAAVSGEETGPDSYIDEVNLRRCVSELLEKSKSDDSGGGSRTTATPEQNLGGEEAHEEEAPSHFVTVIEVKENGNATTATSEVPEESTPTPVAVKEEVVKKTEARRYENVIIETKKEGVRLSNDESKGASGASSTSTFTGGSVLATAAMFASANDAKKKIPPRPPPKFAGKRAPLAPIVPPSVTSPKNSAELKSSSLDRNLKPSEMLRQKSSDSLDVPPVAAARTFTTTGGLSKSVELTDELGKLMKSDSRKSVNSTPTGSLGKTADEASPSGSLSKGMHQSSDAGSKESLGSTGIISERMKSYESVSSLNSDGLKTGASTDDHYYDTVPVENIEGDYVYIQPGSGEPDTATLPIAQARDSTVSGGALEPESPGRNSNYVNIDYFLQKEKNDPRSSSIYSDGEANGNPVILRNAEPATAAAAAVTPSIAKRMSQNRNTTIRQIISSIINSETLYVECLNKMRQYMKAIKASLSQTHPVVSQEDYETMFFKIDELYAVHEEFLTELRTKQSVDADICVGEAFMRLTDQIDMYSAFLHNYGRAIETVKKCGGSNAQFRDIVSKIVLNAPNEQSLTLEDLLHKPVARVQKNALNLQDLLNHTPETHPDYIHLRQAQMKVSCSLHFFFCINIYLFVDSLFANYRK